MALHMGRSRKNRDEREECGRKGGNVIRSVRESRRIEARNRLRDTDATGVNDFNELTFVHRGFDGYRVKMSARLCAAIVRTKEAVGNVLPLNEAS